MAIFDINNTDLILGEYEEFDTISVSEHEFTLSQDERRRHIYAIGQTGTGKTTLLENRVLQDIYAGRGVIDCLKHYDAICNKDLAVFDPEPPFVNLGQRPLRAHFSRSVLVKFGSSRPLADL